MLMTLKLLVSSQVYLDVKRALDPEIKIHIVILPASEVAAVEPEPLPPTSDYRGTKGILQPGALHIRFHQQGFRLLLILPWGHLEGALLLIMFPTKNKH